ncbi:MAG: leucine-rich repeat domain-containing protein [Bacteroidales bacterium]|nr:leucine-rich repeat domain-containing protein [Bacteroidales bacterium]
MKKLLLTLVLLISVIGLNAQNIGSYEIISYNGYDLQYTVKSVSPAECIVALKNLTSETSIPSVVIPETVVIGGKEFSVTTIANKGFAYFYSALKFELPNTLTTIGEEAFYYCNLATEIEIPESVTYIGNTAFYSCPISKVVIPEGVTEIRNGVFNRCLELKDVVIPNSVTSIGIMAFKECQQLDTIVLPESINKIGDNAFSGCKSLSLLVCNPTTPPTANKIFYNVPEDMIIRVPAESLELYKASEPWNKYDIRKIGGEDEEEDENEENIEEKFNSLGIYPNPAENLLFLATEMNVEEIAIYDIFGRKIMSPEVYNSTSQQVVDIADLTTGVYFIKVRTNNNEVTKRFVKK